MFLISGAVCAFAAPPITAIARTPDGKQVVLGSQQGLEIRVLPDLAAIGKLSTAMEHVHDLKFSPDGQWLLAAGGSPGETGRVEVWDWAKRELIREIREHDDLVYRVAWSPDSKRWLTCSGDGRCVVFSNATQVRVAQYDGHSRGVVAGVYLDDRTVATAGIDQTIRLWNGDEGHHQRTLDNHVGTVNEIAARPVAGGQVVDVIASISEDRTVRLWQPRIGRLMRFVRLTSIPRCMAWSPDGKKMYVGCNDGQVRVIDAETMDLVGEFDGLVGRIYDVAVDAVAGCILTAGENGCRSHSWRED
jgi:WD40 repeat protein